MSVSYLPHDQAGELSVLINTDRVRSSIRRLFHNSISECISELFQNSQRAKAKKVRITTNEDGFTYEDDGHGLLGGIAGFHTLLKLAESNFDNDTITDQDPMGLGIHSLLAHDQIQRVTFSSGGLQLALETEPWWKEPEYYGRWYEQLQTLTEPISGLKVSVECEPQLVESLRKALEPASHPFRENTPAQGYTGILEITLEGKPVETGLPSWAQIGKPILKTKYKNCPLTIGCSKSWFNRDSSINWYGQLIKVDFSSSFEFHLEVRRGRPINPLSPSRQGIIKDAAFEALIEFVKDALFNHLFNPSNRDKIEAKWVAGYYRLDPKRAKREAIYIVAARWKAAEDLSSTEDLDLRDDAQLFTYDEAPLLVEEGVTLLLDHEEKPRTAEKGLSSFISMVGEAYQLDHGDRTRLLVGRLWWKPGQNIGEFFREAGEYGITFTEAKPAQWKPVSALPVFTYNDAANWSVEDVDWTVGCENAQEAKIAFLNDQAWAGFDLEHDEANSDELHDSYEQSVAAVIRKIVGNCVPYRFDLHDVSRFMNNKESRILRVKYLYENDATFPRAIKAINEEGENVELRLM
jgi:hypothetical protein